MGKLLIAHCVDTEGPLMEDFDVPFQMVRRIFNIEIAHTRENLKKLRNKEIDLDGKEEAVANLVDPQKSTLGTWEDIDSMLDVVTSKEFRSRVPDCNGEGWKFTWCCVNHTGFKGINPRHRDAGYGNVYRHYRNLVNTQKCGDTIGFHYHPVSLSGNYHDSGTAYWGGENLNQILTHHVIDDEWFPSVFRPGFNTERSDSNWFLEQWIPFDFANNAMNRKASDQPEMANGRFGDWRRAPSVWQPYHPSHDDYQLEGSCHRWIFRILNMYARVFQIEEEDIREGFERAKNIGDTVIAVANHDYKDMRFDIERIQDMISKVSKEYPDVEFEYCDAISAARRVLNLSNEQCGLDVRLDETGIYPRIVVTSEKDIFGPQPFLAIKTLSNDYYWDNFDFDSKNCWSYSFDVRSLPLRSIEKIGVAANSSSGVTEVCSLDPYTGESKKIVWNA